MRGSNTIRTRLYQMAISKYFDELSETLILKELLINNGYLMKKTLIIPLF